MISFSTLGTRSRLGNHLFQYAFLRSTAQRLGVKFYCPEWIGDKIFQLNDSAERVETATDISSDYIEPSNYTGFNQSALDIKDGVNIQGFFQTERYFNRESVLEWYRFNENIVTDVRKKYESINFSESCGIHIRLGDFVTTYEEQYYIPRLDYYQRALTLVNKQNNIIVFSDDIPNAKRLLASLSDRLIFIDGYESHEGILLQSMCHDFICCNSTYGWWGAWLNNNPDRVIIAPSEGSFRPGSPIKNREFWPVGWQTIPALRYGLDHYNFIQTKNLTRRVFNKCKKVISNI